MAYSPLSILLRRRLFLSSLNPRPRLSSLFFTQLPFKPFSTSQDPSSNPKPSSLSARLSFVFDQIDAIEKERSQKDQTLQRIRAWRESKKTQSPQNDPQGLESELAVSVDPNSDSVDANWTESKVEVIEDGEKCGEMVKKEVEVVHPWPEWIELMERLVLQNYFDHRRKDEDKMVSDLGFDATEVPDDPGFDFREFKSVQTACLNFGKDRFDILRSLSRKDIQILVGFGCPTVDNKVVFSAKLLRKHAHLDEGDDTSLFIDVKMNYVKILKAKLLRKHAHLDEGDVCSSCSLRNSCARAYLLTNKEDEARTIDIMRVLLTFGFDPVNGSVMNKSLLKQKSIKTVVRKLLHEVVKLSSVPIDPILPPPVIKKPPPKVKQPPPPPKKRVGRDDVEMKKGDWLCPKCDFMNFAKNTVCLQCDAKRPKRQLLPGEWECPECNFLNYRRNTVCFHCQCKRPPDEFLANKMLDTHNNSKPRLDMRASRPEVSNAWNFDFDDDESDGADVAAFEYADAHAIDEDFPSDSQAQSGNLRGWEGDIKKTRVQGSHDGEFSNSNLNRPGIGFDDFEDDDDDIDSYELETYNDNKRTEATKNDFSEVEDSMVLDDSEDSDDKMHRPKRVASKRSMQFGSRHNNATWSEHNEPDFDSDEQPSVHSNFKSSHVFSARQEGKGRGPRIPSKKLSFGSESDEDVGAGLYSDDEDDLNKVRASRRNGGIRHNFGRSNFNKDRQSRTKGSRGRDLYNDDFDGPSHRSRSNGREYNGRGYQGNGRNLQRLEDRERNTRNFDRSSRGKFGRKQQGRFSGYRMDEKEDFGEFRNSRRVIER